MSGTFERGEGEAGRGGFREVGFNDTASSVCNRTGNTIALFTDADHEGDVMYVENDVVRETFKPRYENTVYLHGRNLNDEFSSIRLTGA
ncbi:peptidase inhibitor family I36 protein [Streptomyces sp. NPDC005728]|uniref:peptidase inhibitor family I36 protein n=1 Tax=Streptomyces sp. NPDC005728 TaxID=3157054 RepID=UPI0033FEEE59